MTVKTERRLKLTICRHQARNRVAQTIDTNLVHFAAGATVTIINLQYKNDLLGPMFIIDGEQRGKVDAQA